MKGIDQQSSSFYFKKPMRFALIMSVLAFLMSDWAGAGNSSSDAMEKGSRDLAGPQAIDCGRVGIHQSPKAATDCALSAFNAGKPFRVRYDFKNIDSSVAAGLIRTPDGELSGLRESGSSNERVRSFITAACPRPVHVWVTKNGHLNCFTASKSNRTFMSSTFSLY
jgi:hypothetical protein